jgi:hypothetical protein
MRRIACTDDGYADPAFCTSQPLDLTRLCKHTARDSACDDHDRCTKDRCDPATGCVHSSICQ